jgi:hypothetical protein
MRLMLDRVLQQRLEERAPSLSCSLRSQQLMDGLVAAMEVVPPHEAVLSHFLQLVEEATAAWQHQQQQQHEQQQHEPNNVAVPLGGGGGHAGGRPRLGGGAPGARAGASEVAQAPLCPGDAEKVLRRAASSGSVRAARAMRALGQPLDDRRLRQPLAWEQRTLMSPLLLLAAGGGHAPCCAG